MPALDLPKIIREGRSVRSEWDGGAYAGAVDAAAVSAIPPLPGNIIEWFEKPGYLFSQDVLERQRDKKTGLYLFPRAFVALRDFFDLLCPYCQKPEEISNTPVEDQDLRSQVLLRDNVCPQCGVTMLDVVKAKRDAGYLECVLALGMGSGKTSLFGGVAAHVSAVCARTPKIREALDFAPGALMQIAFVASTGTQTRSTIWGYFIELVRQSPWWIKAREAVRIASNDGKGELFDDLTTVWEFQEQGFECRSLNSNSGGLAGLRRLVVLLDELARFDVEGKRGAEEMYQVMYGSMKNTWKAYEDQLDRGILPTFKPFMAAFSSPIHEGDKIMSLGADALRDPDSPIYFRRHPTWEWNTRFTKADFARELAINPRRAKRDFGAEPQGYHERLIERPELVDRCCDPSRRNLIVTRDAFFTDPTGVRCLRPELVSCPRDKVTKRFLHCDPGHVGDSFGISIGQMTYERDTNMPRVQIDAILEIRPHVAKHSDGEVRYEVDFIGVTDMLLEICKRLNIVRGSFDHWNSIMSVQRIRMAGVPMDRVNILEGDWNAVADAVVAGYLSLPAPERVGYDAHDRKSPIAKAVYEIKSMERPSEGKVDHPKDGSSDLAVCIAGVTRHMLLEGGVGMLGKVGRDGVRRAGPPGWLPMSASRSLPSSRRVGAVVRFRRL